MPINPAETPAIDSILPPASLESPPTIDFGEAPSVDPCSYNECPQGHKWPPVLRVAQCPGCGGPILAIKMVQCPICNEPVTHRVIRADHLPHGGQITPMCRGAASLAEVTSIDIKCGHAEDEQKKYVDREMPSKV